MNSRERILARIRERQSKSPEPQVSEHEAARAYIGAHARSPAPRDDSPLDMRFRECALSLASTLDEARGDADVPERVRVYLHERELPLRAVCWPALARFDWSAAGLQVEPRSAAADDLVGITGAFCAIAETGTLMLLSGSDTPPTVSLLPETHIAIVSRERIVRSMEDAWSLVRAEQRALPRAVTFISGPSRTADIEQTVTLGAHGPYRVHIILV